MTTRPAPDPHAVDLGTAPDQPVPYTLTLKADAFLDLTAPGHHKGTAIIDGLDGWACGRCGFAWFGPLPDDGLCRNCRTT